MDNPDGPQDSGLADLRLQTGLNFVDYIVKYLTTTYPDKFPDKEVLKNAFKDGGTNVNNPGDEVSPNSEEAKVNQATKFNLDNVKGKTTDTGDTDTGDTDDVPGTEPDLPNGKDVKTYLRTKKPEIDANKLTTIMLLILPNLITDQKLNDFWDVWFDWNSAKEQGLSRKEFIEKEGLPRDQPGYVNKKREYLSNSTDPKAKDALKIFDWALSFKKDPGGFAQLLKNLDSQINITYIKRISTKPGKRGEAAYQGGSQRVSTRASGETTATPVAENINNKLRENIKNIIKSILIEIKSFEELPGFDKNRAIRNLGAVVPLYIYTWDLEDEASIAYVRNVDTYKDSFKKFYSGYSEYPTLTRKVNAYGKTIFNLNEPGRNFDRTANSKRNERDVNKIIEKINKNNTLKTQLNKINNPIKLENLLVTALTYINPNVDKIKVLQQTKNNLPTDLKEEDNPTSSTETSDNRAVNQAIEADTALQNLIKEINNIEEGKQFILRCILPFVNKRINKSYIITAIDNAMKRLENKDDVSLSGDSSSSSSSGGSAGGSSATTGVRTNEHYLRMQFLAGIINESQYKK